MKSNSFARKRESRVAAFTPIFTSLLLLETVSIPDIAIPRTSAISRCHDSSLNGNGRLFKLACRLA